MKLSGDSPREENATYGVGSLFKTASMKKRTRARWTGSYRSRPESGYKSAASSSNTSDLAIVSDSGDRFSGSDLGDPYTRAGKGNKADSRPVQNRVSEPAAGNVVVVNYGSMIHDADIAGQKPCLRPK